MSRNKQVDRLEAGMLKYWTGKIVDPVGSALGLMDLLRKNVADLTREQKRDHETIDSIFMNFYSDLSEAGLSEALVINRKNCPNLVPISLGELGWVDSDPKFDTDEDKIRLITIVWMVISSMRNQILDERKKSYDDVIVLTKKLASTCENHKKIVEWNNSVIKDLKAVVQLRDDEITRSCVVIKDITEELKYQVAATKQYKRELDALRLDIIDREILREEFHN